MMKTRLCYFFALLLLTSAFSCTKVSNQLDVTTHQYQIPVLVNKENNPVLQIQLVPREPGEVVLQQLSINLKSTGDLEDIQAVRLFVTGKDERFITDVQLGSDQPPSPSVVFKDSFRFSDTTYLWVSLELKNKVDLQQKLGVSCESVSTDRGMVAVAPTPHKMLRLGIALRKHGDDGVHTYRIPGLTTTNNGTLLAIYDVRRDSHRDLQGNIDIGLSRSVDGGDSWEPMQIPLDMGEWGGLPQKFNGVSDANILVDRTNNTIFLAGLWMHGVLDKNGRWIEGLTEDSDAWEHQWRSKGSQPGFGVKQTSQFLMARSMDDGKTWSTPENLTEMIKKEEWWLFAPAPGHGITLDDGTLVMPTQGRDESGKSFSNITWSNDGGSTWKASEPAGRNTTENMAVQLSDGSVMLNMRHNGNKKNTTSTNGRAIAVTNNLGSSWTEHPTSRGALVEPTCMASLHKHEYSENGKKKSLLLFSNPNSKTTRDHLTIKVSLDDGKTWPEQYWMLLDEKKSRGYSCLTSIDEHTIGILYEGSQADMTFQKISLSELLDPGTEERKN